MGDFLSALVKAKFASYLRSSMTTSIQPIVIAPPPSAESDTFILGEYPKKDSHYQPQLALQFSPMRSDKNQDLAIDIQLSANLRVGERNPSIWAAKLVAGILEVLAGARSVSQLSMLLSPEVYSVIKAHAQQLANKSPRHRPLVRSVRVCMPTEDVAEAAVVIQGAKRSRAIALRLEVQHGRWRATAIVFG
jgi:hypothetical protein